MSSDFLCVLIFLAGGLYFFSRVRYWLQGYEFSRDGVKMVVFGGRVTIMEIPRARIRDAVITNAYDLRLLSPVVLNLTNRFNGRRLLVRSTGWASYNLSPKDPEAALKALELPM